MRGLSTGATGPVEETPVWYCRSCAHALSSALLAPVWRVAGQDDAQIVVGFYDDRLCVRCFDLRAICHRRPVRSSTDRAPAQDEAARRPDKS